MALGDSVRASILGNKRLKVVPDVFFRPADEPFLRPPPRPKLNFRALGLHPWESIVPQTNRAPRRAVIAPEYLSDITAEYLRKLEDSVCRGLRMLHLLMEVPEYGLDVLDTGVAPIECDAESLPCKVYGVEGICLRDLLNLMVWLKPHIPISRPGSTFSYTLKTP